MSSVLGLDIERYRRLVGPSKGRPPRPTACLCCPATRIWYNGWRSVAPTVLVGPRPEVVSIWVQRVRCSRCGLSWTLRPDFLYRYRWFDLAICEAALLGYLSVAASSYRSVAQGLACSWQSVWNWVSWVASLVHPGEIVAMTVEAQPDSPSPSLIPASVPGVHRKGQSKRRREQLLRAYQVLVALTLLARSRIEAEDDPSPLRAFLNERFLVYRQWSPATRTGFSPKARLEPGGRSGTTSSRGLRRRHRRAPP